MGTKNLLAFERRKMETKTLLTFERRKYTLLVMIDSCNADLLGGCQLNTVIDRYHHKHVYIRTPDQKDIARLIVDNVSKHRNVCYRRAPHNTANVWYFDLSKSNLEVRHD